MQQLRASQAAGLVGALAALVAAVFAVPVACAEVFHWTQYVPGGREARAITDEASCPAADIDGAAATMLIRAAPGPGFPVTICAITIPPSAKSVSVDGVPVALGVTAPRRIAVVGDTGCRLKENYLQDCNDPARWPFPQVVAAIVAAKPDLVIHVGDYHYRETPCPAERAGCAGSPFGDTWAAWRADFFVPASELLMQVPWVMVRGNHEECSRGGHGWSRVLDPGAFAVTAGCNGPDPVFAVPFANIALAVVDVASASEPQLNPKQAARFSADYARIGTLTTGPTWILQHRPIWSPGANVAGFSIGDNKTLAAAARTTLPQQVQMILSGHHHIFQVLGYAQDLPVQVVSGHGGDYLNIGHSVDPAGWQVNGVTVKAGLHTVGQFGFSMLEQHDDGWVITNYDRFGKSMAHCGLVERAVSCVGE